MGPINLWGRVCPNSLNTGKSGREWRNGSGLEKHLYHRLRQCRRDVRCSGSLWAWICPPSSARTAFSRSMLTAVLYDSTHLFVGELCFFYLLMGCGNTEVVSAPYGSRVQSIPERGEATAVCRSFRSLFEFSLLAKFNSSRPASAQWCRWWRSRHRQTETDRQTDISAAGLGCVRCRGSAEHASSQHTAV